MNYFDFPVTLLGDVRREYLMPKICAAKIRNSGTVKPVDGVAASGEGLSRKQLLDFCSPDWT